MKLTIAIIFMCLFFSQTQAQALLNKLKQRAEQAAEQAIDKKIAEKRGANTGNLPTGPGGTSSSGTSNHPTNKGGGLISTPPDVNQQLKEAENAYALKSYSQAREAVQQAMLGVELEIGNIILKSLPEVVSGLPKQTEADQVTSMGYGWVGLTIYRQYLKDDKELRVTIANNSAWMTALNMYLSNNMYAQTTNGEQQMKQIKVKGNKGLIEYNESSGYKISIALGQSSLLVWEGVNFASESDMLKAAESFNSDAIKKQLGEQ